MKNRLYSMAVVALCLISGCAPTIPSRVAISYNFASSPPPGFSRIYFYSGQWMMGGYEHDLKIAGDVYINNRKIGYFNAGEAIVADLKAGPYELYWIPVVSDIDRKKTFPSKLVLNLQDQDIKYLEGDWIDRTSSVASVFGVIGSAVGAQFEAALVDKGKIDREKVHQLRIADHISFPD